MSGNYSRGGGGGRLANYAEVKSRIPEFWARYPDGALVTEILHHDLERVLVQCRVYRQTNDSKPIAVGHAEEQRTTDAKKVNTNSAVENCFAPETEILTASGWVNIADFVTERRTEAVANLEHGRIRFDMPLAWIERESNQLILIEDNKTRQRVTPEHRVLVGSEYHTAQSMYEAEEIAGKVVPGFIPQGGSSLVQDSPGVGDGSDLYARFLQWVIADGNINYAYGYCRFGFTKDRKVERLTALLDELGYRYVTSIDKNGIKHINVHQCWHVLADLPQKTLSFGLMMRFTDAQAMAFIDEIAHTDGMVNRNGIYLRSVDREYIENLCTLGILHGYDVSALTFDEVNRKGAFPNAKPLHRVVLKRTAETVRRYRRHYLLEEFPEAISVYCLTMPSGNVVTRNQGKITVSGQCETSAIGRALANLGITMAYERPSMEEIEKDERMRGDIPLAARGPGKTMPQDDGSLENPEYTKLLQLAKSHEQDGVALSEIKQLFIDAREWMTPFQLEDSRGVYRKLEAERAARVIVEDEPVVTTQETELTPVANDNSLSGTAHPVESVSPEGGTKKTKKAAV